MEIIFHLLLIKNAPPKVSDFLGCILLFFGVFYCYFQILYNPDLAEWEYQVGRKPTTAAKDSVRNPLAEIADRLSLLEIAYIFRFS